MQGRAAIAPKGEKQPFLPAAIMRGAVLGTTPRDMAKIHFCAIPLPTLFLLPPKQRFSREQQGEVNAERMPCLHIPADKWEFGIWTTLGLPSLGSAK